MIGHAVIFFVLAMGAAWLFRELLIRTLRSRHPQVLAGLGNPTSRQLASLMPRYREQQLAFFRYLWGSEPLALGDRRVATLAWGARAADLAAAGGMALVFWSAGH